MAAQNHVFRIFVPTHLHRASESGKILPKLNFSKGKKCLLGAKKNWNHCGSCLKSRPPPLSDFRPSPVYQYAHKERPAEECPDLPVAVSFKVFARTGESRREGRTVRSQKHQGMV